MRAFISSGYGVTRPTLLTPSAANAARMAWVLVSARTPVLMVMASVIARSCAVPNHEPAVPLKAITSTSAVASSTAAASIPAVSNWASEVPSSPTRPTGMRAKWTLTSVRSPSIRYVVGSRQVFDDGTIIPIRATRQAVGRENSDGTGDSAVVGDRGSVQVRGPRRGEEHDRVGDVARAGDVGQRQVLQVALLGFFGRAAPVLGVGSELFDQTRGPDRARADGVDHDALGTDLK